MTVLAILQGRRMLTWLLAGAVLLAQALVPLAPAGPAGAQVPLMLELCTASGLQRIAIDPGGGAETPERRTGLHCPLCIGPLLAAAIGPAPALGTPVAAIVVATPVVSEGIVPAAGGIAAHGARAPPVS